MDPIESAAPAAAPAPEAKPASNGPILGIVVILAAIVLGAWYMWDQKVSTTATAADVTSLEAQGTSTDPDAIESDLSAQSPDNFDSGIDAAFGELDTSFDGN